ncbi:remorin family protein isoform X1 [Zea mays]|uniref:Remorin family protein n=6 Tax=Zea mays TaxID=4577 RepID=A0A1D6I5R6_MAIZE|nr:remorin family protein isoform X1 [Zea mays]XP_008651735.1 remorin family protein isoform X1 [Zea mays]XP_020396248.1 remorin family protein isoform X1 [Zea mays]XP_020396249.1 remorin family protein isoform X1 [Zea mays]ONM55443.1 Remorin family protein [Zea mays]ONM55444.1 Remorin family protein [Zea mays]|eukprot:XP_008651734.1 remorin family protein isoform X1 [Zea mays]
MRGGGGASWLSFRGVVVEEEEAVVSAPEKPMRRGRRRWGAEVDDGYSPSSTGGGGSSCCDSFGCDSPLAGFVRPDGDPDTDLETDGLATSTSSASAAFTERQDDEAEEALYGVKEEEWAQIQEPAKNPAFRATPECHKQRYRTDAAVLLHGRKGSKQRPASLDLGSPGFHGATFSPSFVIGGVGLMNKGLGASVIRSDVFHSPGTPNYPRHRASVLGCHKGWSSERVPHPSKGNRRYPGSSMAFPYSNGRTLPSKWEDAERWIFSPNSSDALGRTTVAHARRPKSKSGPLGPPGRLGGQYSSVSSVSLLDNGRAGPITANSPFAAGVLMPEHVCEGKSTNGTYSSRPIGNEINIGRGVKICPLNGGSHPVRTSRVRQRLDYAVESSVSLPSTQESVQDEQVEITEDSASTIASIISRKDAATQTSPELSRSSSPNTRPTFNGSLSTEQVKEKGSCLSDLDIRDVQMDDRVTLTRWSKKNVTRSSNKNSTNIIEWSEKTVESKSSSWGFAKAKCISKIDREDTEITAWENIEKAKADAAIQKLVIKLEKKRSSSLDKILNTLKSAQRKSQVMHEHERDAVTANQDGKGSRKAKKRAQLSKNGQISSLSGCFTCHAF